MLFGCFRKADANDPEIYVAAVTAVLSEYAPEIVEYVCDPRTGLPRRLKWLPTLAEVAEACDQRKEYAESVKRLRALVAEKRAILADPSSSTADKARAQEFLDRVKL